jgi:cob(I)alamin adenosyltransferase
VTCIRERGLSHLIPAQNYLNRLADYLFILAVWKEKHE